MSRTRVLYEHPLAYAASPVSITYKGRLGEHDLVYFANLFPGNRGIFQIDLESGGVRQLARGCAALCLRCCWRRLFRRRREKRD